MNEPEQLPPEVDAITRAAVFLADVHDQLGTPTAGLVVTCLVAEYSDARDLGEDLYSQALLRLAVKVATDWRAWCITQQQQEGA